jgi:hypothetical protein
VSQASYTGHRLQLDADCSRCGNRATTVVKIKVNDQTRREFPCCQEHAQEVGWEELRCSLDEEISLEVLES